MKGLLVNQVWQWAHVGVVVVYLVITAIWKLV